jgi:hypothetical protein
VKPAATNDLVEIKKLAIVCDDCGRRRVWRKGDIARAQAKWGVRTAFQLGPRLTCKHCVERGQGGHNVSIYVDPIACTLLENIMDESLTDNEAVH